MPNLCQRRAITDPVGRDMRPSRQTVGCVNLTPATLDRLIRNGNNISLTRFGSIVVGSSLVIFMLAGIAIFGDRTRLFTNYLWAPETETKKSAVQSPSSTRPANREIASNSKPVANIPSINDAAHVSLSSRAALGVKNDRLPPPLDDQRATRVSIADAAAVRSLGRPSIDAIWNGRMRLPAPSEWLNGARAAPQSASSVLAYAPSAQERLREGNPFAVIDKDISAAPTPASLGERTAPSPTAAKASGLASPVIEEEDDGEEDEEPIPTGPVIPRPLPRPKLQPTVEIRRPLSPPLRSSAATNNVSPTPLRSNQNDPKPAAPRVTENTETHHSENQNYVLLQNPTREIVVAPPSSPILATSLPVAIALAPPSGQPAITLRTPFGIPYSVQHDNVDTSCFPPPLVELIRKVGVRYGQKPIITSGLRGRGRSGSLHRRCLAADIMIPGVSSQELAKAARQIPGMGGVGQYCHPNLVHIDVGTARDWKHGCGGFFALRDGADAVVKASTRQ